MKQYLLFAHNEYYPGGGFEDFQGGFDTLPEAMSVGHSLIVDKFDYYEVMDVVSLSRVAEGQRERRKLDLSGFHIGLMSEETSIPVKTFPPTT